MKKLIVNLSYLLILVGINTFTCKSQDINTMWKGPLDCSADCKINKCDSGVIFIFNVTDDAIVVYKKNQVRDYKDYNDRIDMFLDGRKYNGGKEVDWKASFVNLSLVPVFEKDNDLCYVRYPNIPILKSEYKIRSEITPKGYYIECFLNYGFFNRINFPVSKGFNFLVVISDADKNLRETRISSGKLATPDIIADNFEYADFKENTYSFSINKRDQVITPPLYLVKLNIKAGVLPEIGYTPKPDNVNSLIQILDGKWKFYPEIPGNFPAAKGDSVKEIIIPCSHSLQGYLFGKKETGGWVTTFFVPESWKNKNIKLRFLSIEGLAKVYVNNQMAGSHDGQYMAFELDITKYVKYNSPNELAVSIFKDSKISISSSRNTGYIHGDITRSVELLAVPELHFSKIYINTDFDKEFIDGKLKIDCQITNNESRALKPQIRFNLTGPKGEQISLFPLKEDLAVIQAQTTIQKQVDITIPKAIKWDYEHPNLYKLTAELILENQSCEIVSRNIGFRKVEIRGNEIFLNNRSIKIKGTNYHPSHPLTGWALPKEFAIKHVKLLKEANINYVRIWPHMEEFIDECDKAGMLLQVEVPFSFLSQDKFLQDSLYVKDGIKLAMEMIDFYRNHPSVIVWSVGNESSYLPVFEHMAVSVKKADNSRPVIMSENSARGLGIPSLDFDTEHYPAINACSRSDISRPILYTEWCHTNSYNIPEFTTDPGLRDFWVNFLRPHIEYIYNNKDGSIGGCLFTSITLTYRFPQGIEGAISHPFVWGFIDEWCRPQPEYWHVKKTNSPVQITDSKSSGDKVQLSVESRFDFTNMNELNIKWNCGVQSGKISPDIKPRSKGIIEIPVKTNNTDKLHISFNSPYGYIIDEYEFNFNNETIKKPVMTTGLKAPEINETDSLIFVKSKNLVFTFSKNTGFIKSIKDNIGNIILHNTPEFFAAETPQNIKDIVLTGWKLGNLKCYSTGNKAIVNVTGKYNEAEGKYAFTINNNNEFSIDYEIKWTGNDRTVKEIGICLKMPESFNILTWKRKGFWNYYPSNHIGRIEGTANMFRNKTFTPTDPYKSPGWNWEEDETLNGTNDFRSTKYNIYNASLSNTEYRINVLSDGSQNIRTWYNNESRNTSMLVTYVSNGGWENFLRGDANLRSDLVYLKTDDVIKDKVCFNIEKLNKKVLLDAEMTKANQQPAGKISRNNMITPGQIWNDSDGKPIESHLGGVLFENGVYYWYGMNWDGPTIPPNTIPRQSYSWFLNRGITIYSSKDLYQWKHESTVLTEVGCEPGQLLQPLNGLVRPMVIRNNTTGKYVMMAALISPDFETFNDIVVAVGDSPVGPFELKGKLGWRRTPNLEGFWTSVWKQAATDTATRIRGFDMGLFKDDDGKAFLIVAHSDVFIYELSEDYLSVTRVERMDGAEGEAPAMFKAEGTYYLLTSRLSGWAPNQNTYFTARSIRGPWKPGGPFAKGPKEQTTFDSQVTFVLPLANKPNAFIFMADLFHCVSGTDVPDLRKAVHVWLPIELDRHNQSIRVTWKDQWELSVFDYK